MDALLGLFLGSVLLVSTFAASIGDNDDTCEDSDLRLASGTYNCTLLLEENEKYKYVGAYHSTSLCKEDNKFHGCCKSCCQMPGVDEPICKQFETTTTTTTTTTPTTTTTTAQPESTTEVESVKGPISVNIKGQDRDTYQTLQNPVIIRQTDENTKPGDIEVDIHLKMNRYMLEDEKKDLAVELFLRRKKLPQ